MSEPSVDEMIGDVTRPRILLVEDDVELREMVARLLHEAGYRVDALGDGHRGLHHALTHSYAAMIIDRGVPAIDGLDLTLRLRRQGVATPIMMLTAYGTVADRVAGLDAGAEDYLVKPFEIDELLARVRALIRRHRSGVDQIMIGGGELDMASRTARRGNGVKVELSGREATLLRCLAARSGRVMSRDELRAQVFDAAESATIVDTYVHYLRRKLGSDVVRTVRGLGYRIGEM